MKTKRFLSLLLALCTMLSVLASVSFTASAATVEVLEVSADTQLLETGANYGLAKNIQDGNILHCFNWKYNDIKAELKNIAEAGFTSVQTSPAQPAGSGEWYWLYQPYGFYIGNNSLGSKDDLKNLCTEADKYGIKVIVDVVANHLNGDTGRVQDDLRDGQYWHNHGSVSNWADRYQVTQGEIGMRDLNSEHSYVQQKVAGYIKELEGVGVDGIRWDAAKHIALPSENCNFWKAVTSNNSLWHYGEILVGPDDRSSGNEGLMKEYTNYMSVTDSSYGAQLRESFNGGNAPSSHGNWASRGVVDNKLVYWGESHDTYSNGPDDWGASTNMSQNTIDRAYAVAASRNGANALYFSRPNARDKGGIHSGQKGSTSFKNKEVAAVNQLKNACVGEKDYFQNADNCAVVCRESGAVIVLGGGSNRNVNVPNGGSTTRPGTFTDLVSGATFTVTSTNISGQVGSSGIAVLLNAKPAGPSASVSPSSQNYTTETLELTLSFDNAVSGQYSINGGAYQSFTNGQKLVIGKGTAAGTQTTISVKASDGSQTSDVETYEYNYAELADKGIYCNSTGTGWSSVNCYVYKNGQGYKEWPGEVMTSVGDNLWYYEIPAGYENCQVIFSQSGNNQYPADDGLQYGGGAMIYSDGQWQQHTVVKPVSPTAVAPNETQTPAPTQAQPTQVPATQATKPGNAPTQPLKTDPIEGDDIIVVPPAPGTKPTNPSPAPTVPDVAGGDKYKYGDVDLNEKITIKDATAIQKALAQLTNLSNLQLIVSDVNGDGKVNVKDGTTIQKYCALLTKSFESGEWYTVPGSSTVEPTEAPSYKPVVTDPAEAPLPVPTQAPVKPTTTPAQPTEASALPTEAPAKPTEAPAQPTEAPTQPLVDNCIYVKSTWSSVNCHSWASDGSNETNWPGNSMKSLGNGVFSIQLPDGHDRVVFNGDGQQTKDITVEGTGMIWDGGWQPYTNGNTNNNTNTDNNIAVSADCIYFIDNAGWGSVSCHSWSSNGGGETTWPGTAMESLGNGLYKIKLPDGHTNVVFNAGGEHCKTDDLNAQLGKAYNNSTGQWENI